ncbi:hypothetical protein [Gordonia sp. OPL2]|nr:hypothetical protein [Gordonia sp. OPL2]
MIAAAVLIAVLAAAGALVWRLNELNARAAEHNTMTGRTGPDDQEAHRGA